MSHELRTPLTAVIAFAELLETGVLGPVSEKQQNALERIGASSWHLVGIIEEILSLSRMEAGKEEVHSERTDVAELAREVVGIVERQADAKGLLLRLDGADAALTCRTDPLKVRQVLLNLVGNAIKYTAAGAVVVRLERSGADWLELVVRDTGSGIAAEDQARIFEPFTQVDSSYTRRASGTGLGLPIARNLARLLGGDISVHSTPGEGSTFTFTLPLLPEERE
jgi:signal transduction histidine kinase